MVTPPAPVPLLWSPYLFFFVHFLSEKKRWFWKLFNDFTIVFSQLMASLRSPCPCLYFSWSDKQENLAKRRTKPMLLRSSRSWRHTWGFLRTECTSSSMTPRPRRLPGRQQHSSPSLASRTWRPSAATPRVTSSTVMCSRISVPHPPIGCVLLEWSRIPSISILVNIKESRF